MRISGELQALLKDNRRQSLEGQKLPELLEGLDRLLKLGAPKVHESLRPAAAPSDVRALTDFAGCEGSVPEALLIWFGWRDGQGAEPHRALTPKNDYHALLSVEQSRELVARARGSEHFVPGWVPLAARPDSDEEFGLGLLTQGPHAGQLCKLDRPESPSYPDLASFVRAITLKFQDVVSLPEPGQYWVHGVGALLLEANRYHHALPGGLWPIASANCSVTIFREHWDVRSLEQLLDTLATLEASHTGSPLGSDGLAFKLGVASSLAALGRVAGWLSAEEAWTMQLRFANAIQRAFSSWREFGEAYVRGFRAGDGEDDYLQRLLADPTSPFHLPWHTPLNSKPTPDPPVECFELTPDDHERLNDLLGHFRSPRLIDIRLEAGFYVVEQQVTQPVRLRGESTEDTVIQGMRSGQEAFWVVSGGFELQDLTIEHDAGEEARKEDVADALTLQGAVVFARRCKFVGSRNGVVISNSSWGQVLDCEFVGQGHTGLSVGGAAVLSGGTAHGQVIGLFVWEGATCWARGLRATGGKVGFRLEESTAHLVDVETEGQKGDGLVMAGASHLVAERCRFRSLEETAVSSKNDDLDSPWGSALFKACELGPSDWSMYIGAGLRARVEGGIVHSKLSAAGGSVVLVKSQLDAHAYASERGFLGIVDTPVRSQRAPSLQARQQAAIRIVDSSVQNGLRTKEGGVIRASCCSLSVSSEVPVVDAQGGHVALRDCNVTQPHDLHALVVSGGSLSAVDCLLQSEGQVIAGVQKGATTHWWRCRFASAREDAVLLFNEGITHLYASTLHSAGHGFYCQNGGAGYADSCHTETPQSPFAVQEGSVISREHPDVWPGLTLLGPSEAQLDLAQLPQEVRELLNEVSEHDDGAAGQLARAALALVAPGLAADVEQTRAVVRITTSVPLEPAVQHYLARAFTRLDTALAVLWTIEPDLSSERGVHLQTFSYGMLQWRGAMGGADG